MVRYQIFIDQNGQYRWRLVAANNEIVAVGESYLTKQGAINAANWVKANASWAPIHNLTK